MLVGALSSQAQIPGSGVLQGRVRGLEGERISGAAVRLTSVESAATYYARADAGGQFGFLNLRPGGYTASVRMALSPFWTGAARIEVGSGTITGVELHLASDSRGTALVAVLDGVDEDVGDGAAQDPAAATGVSSLLTRGRGKNASTGMAGAIPGTELQELPLLNRQWEAVQAASSQTRDATLAGGGSAQDDTEASETASAREERQTGSAASGLSFDALPVTGNAETVDGLSAGQAFRAGPRGAASGAARAGSTFAEAAVGHVRVTPRSYTAQAGGSSGGVLAVSTRGIGAGRAAGVHGSGFLQAREAAWEATNPFAVVATYGPGGAGAARVRPADSDLQFGGGIGASVRVPGAGRWGRVGLFGAAEGRDRRQTVFSSPATANFFQLSPTQRALLLNRGVRAAQIGAALGYLASLGGPGVLPSQQWHGFGRADLAPGSHDLLSLTYSALRSAVPAATGLQTAEGVITQALGSVGQSAIDVDAGTAQWTHVLGPRWTNSLRGQLARDVEAEQPGPGSAGVPAVGPGGLAPQVTLAPTGFQYGTPASLGRIAYPDERRVEVADTSVWRFGRHFVSVGGSWSRVDDRVAGVQNAEGTFVYDSGTTGGHAGGLVDWITDYTFNVNAYPNAACPSINAAVHYFCFRSYSQSFANSEVEFVTHEVAGFAEDAMRLRPDLRLSVGARWEYQLLPYPLLPNPTLDAAMRGAGGGAALASTSSFPEDRNNVGPRVALTWAPGARARHGAWFSLQAGYGMFFGRVPGATLRAALTETGVAQAMTTIRITPKTEVSCPQLAMGGFGYPCSFPYAPVGVAPVAQTTSSVMFASRFRLPAVQRASLGLGRELGRWVKMRATYATAWAVQLPETTDINIAPSTQMVSYVLQGGDGQRGLWTGQSFQVPLYTARRSDKYGPVTMLESNANASFHSVTGEAEVRGWHGLSVRGSSTWSKALDYGPQVGASPRQDGQFDPFSNGYDKGRSSLDRPWQAAGTVLYRSQWEQGEAWKRWVVGGWGLGVLGRAGSGAPYSYVIFDGTRLAGGHTSINGSGGAAYLPTVGRNTLRLPGRSKVDVRASREMHFAEGTKRPWRLEVHGDAFNVLNTVGVSRVESRAFLVGDSGSVGGMTPLIFQDAATVAAEGLSTPAFGTPLSSTSGLSRERTVELGARVSF